MADKKYNLAFELSDGTTKNVQFSVPHVEVGKDVPTYDEHKNVAEQISMQAKRITNLEKGVAADSFETDDSVAYVKSVPANSAPYAAISKVGGMTHRVNVGTEDAPVYELRNAAVTEFVSKGVNLLRFQERTITTNGITFVGNSDGTITANGTATAHAYFSFLESVSLDETGAGYLLDGCPEGGSDAKYLLQLYYAKEDGSAGQLIMSEFGRGQPFTAAYKNITGMVVVRSGTTVTNLVFKPRIVDQSKKDMPFRKAFCTNYPLPEAVKALEGYGQGNPENPDEYNAIVWREDGRCVYEHKGNNEDDAWVALDAVEVTDISDILPADNLIEVEGGGTITFENDHGHAVPSEVVYQMKGASE